MYVWAIDGNVVAVAVDCLMPTEFMVIKVVDLALNKYEYVYISPYIRVGRND